MSSFKFLFFGWLFASQKKREMLCISRPEFALQTRAFQGSVRTSYYLHSFATLRNGQARPSNPCRKKNPCIQFKKKIQRFPATVLEFLNLCRLFRQFSPTNQQKKLWELHKLHLKRHLKVKNLELCEGNLRL